MTVHCINLLHREDRRSRATRQAKEQGFEIRFWPGIINKHSLHTGICQAHKQIVQYAKEEKLSSVTIMEDDTRFFGPGAFKHYIKHRPIAYDIYLGMIYVGKIEKNVVIEGWSGMTLYTVHQRFYDKFLSIPDDSQIDQRLGEMCRIYKFVVCNPFVCEQDGSYSDHKMSSCDYSSLLKGRLLFGK